MRSLSSLLRHSRQGWAIGFRLWLVATFVAGLVFTVAPVAQVGAASFTVTNTNDSGSGSLREALTLADGNSQSDTITITATGTLALASELPQITTPIIINGPGAGSLTISGTATSRIFNIAGGTVTISGVTISGGNAITAVDQMPARGGGIYIDGANVSLTNSVVTGNTATEGGSYQVAGDFGSQGGGIYLNNGTLSLTNTTVSNNTAVGDDNKFAGQGGGIYVANGSVTLDASTVISGNLTTGGQAPSGGQGGGLYLASGAATLNGSTVSNNTAQGEQTKSGLGGGVYVATGTFTATTATISGNAAADAPSYSGGGDNGGLGGGLYVAGGTATLTGSTLSGNTAESGQDGGEGGGAFVNGGTVDFIRTTVSNNTAAGGKYAFNTMTGSTGGKGGGIAVGGGSTTISQSALTFNNATAVSGESNSLGGGLYLRAGMSATLVNSTVYQNTAQAGSVAGGSGGGLALATGSSLTVRNSTVHLNSAVNGPGGNIRYAAVSTASFVNTIVSGGDCSTAAALISSNVTDNGSNIDQLSSCGFIAGSSVSNTDPLLNEVVKSNQNPTLYLFPSFGSAAIDKGDDTVCIATGLGQVGGVDQRGIVRPVDGDNVPGARCDIGSIEASVPNPVPTITTLQPNSVAQGSATFTLTVIGTGFRANGLSTVHFGNTVLATTFVSDTELQATVPANLVTAASTVSVTVVTTGPGDGGTSNAVNFTIDGLTSPVVVSPSSLAFGNQLVNSTANPRQVTLTNNNGNPLPISSVVISGTNAGDFAITNNTCVGNITSGTSCVIAVNFTPTATGARSANLVISYGAAGSPSTVALTGTGALGSFNVNAEVSGPGTITPGTGVRSFTSGSQANYTAAPTGDAVFLGWTLDGEYVGFSTQLGFVVNGDRNLTAVFAARPRFSDVAPSDPDYQAISFLAALGVINPNGVNGSGQFQPEREVARAEVAAFVARVFNWQKEFHSNSFPDKCDANGQNCIDEELWNNVAALADYGVVGGYTDPATCQSAGTSAPCYLPRDSVKRVQIVSIVARAFIKTPNLRPTGFWDRQPANGAQYTNVPNTGTQRSDLTTYTTEAGLVPGQSTDTIFVNPDASASRRFIIQVLYQAYAAQFSTDNVP